MFGFFKAGGQTASLPACCWHLDLVPPGTRSEQSFGKVLTASCRQAARTPKAAVRLPDSEQSFGMSSQAAGKSPILTFGQRAAASWLRGGLDMAPPQPNKVSGCLLDAADRRCGLTKPASSHAVQRAKTRTKCRVTPPPPRIC